MSKYKNVSLVSAATLALSLPYAHAADVTDQTTNVLEALVVNASKRSVAADQIDSAVTIKTAEELENAKVTQVQDLEKVFPGLLIRTRGNRAYSSATIRGISSPDFYSPSVQIYVDGVPQDSAFMTQELINVDYVELLRGPQGTLYGGNAQGGIINIVTRKDVEGSKVSATLANNESGLSLSHASQLSDELFADINLRKFNEEGDIDYVSGSQTTRDANDSETLSGQVRLHYLSDTSPLELTFAVSHDELETHEEWYLSEADYKSGKTATAIPIMERQVNSYSLSANYELDSGTLTSVTSYQDRTMNRTYVGGTWDEDQDSFNQEVRLSRVYSNGVSSVVGLNYKENTYNLNNHGFMPYYTASLNEIKKETLALFGEAQIPLADDIDFTAGLRISNEDASINYGGRTGYAPSFGYGSIAAFSKDASEVLVSPKAAIGWQMNDNNRLYASYTRGYRPGGFNYTVVSADDEKGFDAEKSDNVELGWRCECADSRLLVEAALYWIQLSDTQLYNGPIGSQIISNFGKTESKGIEINLDYSVTSDFTLNAGATLGQSRFKNNGSLNLSGNKVPYAPDTTLIAGFVYDLSEQSVTFGANANYYSKTYFNESNTLSQDAYSLLDAFVTYHWNALDIKVYGKNLTDKEYVSYRFTQGANELSNYATGRTLGVDLSMEF